jgi:predicted ferric reductase
MTTIETKPEPKLTNPASRWIAGIFLTTLLYLSMQLFVPGLDLTTTFSQSDRISWYLTRSSGTVGYLLMTGSTIWGLLLSTKIIKEWLPPPVALSMHNTLSWTAIGLSAFHAYLLLFDTYYTYAITDLLVPFTGPYSPFWVGFGIISLYLMSLISWSFSWRNRIGQINWRRLHYLAFVGYIMTTLHGMMAGTDATALMPIYVGSIASVLFLTLYRILTSRK